jgi:hypothetical protein
MKPPTVVFIFLAFLGIGFAGCGRLTTMFAPQPKYVGDWHPDTSTVGMFLYAAGEAATQLPLSESLSDWQTYYDDMKHLANQLPQESLPEAEEKECTAIIEQMEIGKLALQLKQVDPKAGLKQCKFVAATASKHIKKAKTLADVRTKAEREKRPPQDF